MWSNTGKLITLYGVYEETSGSTTARTYKDRVGGDSTDVTMNDDGAGSRLFGGISVSSLIVEEISS